MKKILFLSIFMAFACALTNTRHMDPDLQFVDQIVMTGSIQFPKNIDEIPDIRIYYAGNKLKGERDNTTKKSVFAIPTNKHASVFYILICEHIQAHTQDDIKNLVHYLKVKPNTPYKLYRIDLVNKPVKHKERGFVYEKEWRISQMTLNADGRIPDYAIIICYNPEFVDTIEALSGVELPSIKIRSDLLAYVGSQEALEQHSVELLMASLDMDLIHATIKPDLKKNYEKTIVAMITH